MVLTGACEQGYRNWDDAEVKEYLTEQVKNDKKAELILNRAKDVKTLAQAKAQKGATADTLTTVTFANPPFVGATRTAEPLIAGEMAKMKAGQFSGAVKGNGGVFFFQLIDKKSTGEKYDEKTEMQGVAQTNLRIMANQLANDLARKADVVDNRYKF